MKKLIAFFVLLTLRTPCFAGCPLPDLIQMWSAGGTPPTALCDSSTADYCEDQEAPGARLTWNDVTTGGTINEAASHSGTLACTDKGSYAFDYVMGSTAGDLYSTLDMGSQQNVVYLNFYVIARSLGSLGSFESHQIIGGSNNANGTIPGFAFVLRNTSGNPSFRMSYNNSASVTTAYTISLNTWMRISIQVERVGDGSDIVRLYYDGTLNYETTAATLNTSILARYITRGTSAEIANSANVSFQIDNMQISFSSMPGACP